MLDFDCLGDFDVFVDGEFFARLRYVTYGEALDWTWPLVCCHPDSDVDICLVSDGD